MRSPLLTARRISKWGGLHGEIMFVERLSWVTVRSVTGIPVWTATSEVFLPTRGSAVFLVVLGLPLAARHQVLFPSAVSHLKPARGPQVCTGSGLGESAQRLLLLAHPSCSLWTNVSQGSDFKWGTAPVITTCCNCERWWPRLSRHVLHELNE